MSQPEIASGQGGSNGQAQAREPAELRRGAAGRSLMERFAGLGPIIGLIVLCAVGAGLNSDFATLDNGLNVLTRTAFIGIIAVGMCFVIILGGIDLSVGSMAALIAGCVIMFINWAAGAFASPLMAVIAGTVLAVGLGAGFGLAHGLLIAKGRIEPFIVTLGTLGIYRAYLTYFADGGALTLENSLADLYAPVYYGNLFGVPLPVVAFLVVAVIGAVILNKTTYGRHVQAIGSNETVARYAAVDVERVKILTYMLLGICVGVATLFYVPRLGSASPTTGLLWELEAIAAVIVGGAALKGGHGSIVGTIIGAILLSVISNILHLTSLISVYLNAAVQGFVIIIVAFMQKGRR